MQQLHHLQKINFYRSSMGAAPKAITATGNTPHQTPPGGSSLLPRGWDQGTQHLGLLFLAQQTINTAQGNPRESEWLLSPGSDGTREAVAARAAAPGLQRAGLCPTSRHPAWMETPQTTHGLGCTSTGLLQGREGAGRRSGCCLSLTGKGKGAMGKVHWRPKHRFQGKLCIFSFFGECSQCVGAGELSACL